MATCCQEYLGFLVDWCKRAASVFLACALFVQTHAQVEIPHNLIEQIKGLSPQQQSQLAREYGLDLSDLSAFSKSFASDGQGPDVSVVNEPQVLQQNAVKPSLLVDLDEDLNPSSDGFSAQDTRDEDEDEDEDEATDKTRPLNGAVETLKRFGVDVFDQETSTFVVSDNLPVRDSYVVGVGDEIHARFLGRDEKKIIARVDRDGRVVFQKLGEIQVAGMAFAEVKALIKQKVQTMMIGSEVIVTLGPPRRINVFAAGEVRFPGNYALSNSTTAVQLLFVAGGPSEIGSFRVIEIKRNDKTIGVLDLYDLFLHGGMKEDARLQEGDVLFVPPVQKSIAIHGQVLRPAIFELLEGETLSDAITMAGGFLPDALVHPAVLHSRVPESELPTLRNLDLSSPIDLAVPVRNGDSLAVSKLPSRFENPITITGAVEHPGVFAWFEGVRVSHFIPCIDGRLKNSADLDRALIVRRRDDRLKVDIIEFSLHETLRSQGTIGDPVLKPHDEIIVFSRSESRSQVLKPIVTKLNEQATFRDRPRVIEIKGDVADPGSYPLIKNHTISQAIDLAGGAGFLNLSVDMDIAVIIRRISNLVNKIEAIPFRLDLALEQPLSEHDLKLEPMDEVLILSENSDDGSSNRRELLQPVIARLENQATRIQAAQVVSILGQVREPGDYPILNTLNIDHLIELAGGFSEGAYTKSAEISRVKISAEQISSTEMIEVPLDEIEGRNTLLRSRDVLRINRMPGWREAELITVSGEVMFPGSYALQPGERLSQLMTRVGGPTSRGFLQGAVYTNRLARERQKQRSGRYLRDLKKVGIQKELSEQKQVEDLEELLDFVQKELNGRVTIDLEAILAGDPVSDPVLQEGDSLHIPRETHQVAVIGEVFEPGSFSFDDSLKGKDYIELAGNMTRYADKRRAYVIKANGEVRSLGRRWFKTRRSVSLDPGDTIVVPMNLDYEKPLSRIKSFSSVAFQSLTSVAALLNISKL